MRGQHVTSVLGVFVFFAVIATAGFELGLNARAAHLRGKQSDQNAPGVRQEVERGTDKLQAPLAVVEPAARTFNPPRSYVLRYGLVELLPADLTQSATDNSALLREAFEAAAAALIEGPLEQSLAQAVRPSFIDSRPSVAD